MNDAELLALSTREFREAIRQVPEPRRSNLRLMRRRARQSEAWRERAEEKNERRRQSYAQNPEQRERMMARTHKRRARLRAEGGS